MTNKNALTDTLGRRNRSLENRACAQCGTIFRPHRDSSKYCSRPCAWANNGGHNRKPERWWINAKGYMEGTIWIDEHTRIQVKRHRWLMEQKIGRKLLPNEDVHHKDENKLNNDLNNLEIIDHGKHSSYHNKKRIPKTGYKMNLNPEQRAARSIKIKQQRADWKARAILAAVEGTK